MRAQFFLGESPLAEFDLPEHITLAGKLYAQNSLTYVCAHCGQAWAKCILSGRPYDSVYSTCSQCPIEGTIMIPGSLLRSPGWEHFHNYLPLSLWRREVNLHLAMADTEAV